MRLSEAAAGDAPLLRGVCAFNKQEIGYGDAKQDCTSQEDWKDLKRKKLKNQIENITSLWGKTMDIIQKNPYNTITQKLNFKAISK